MHVSLNSIYLNNWNWSCKNPGQFVMFTHPLCVCHRELNWPWCMKPLLQSPTPSITASSRVEQSPWETKSMTHTVGQSQCLFTPFHTQQTAAPLAWGNNMYVRVVMMICEPRRVLIIYVCNKDNGGLSLAVLFKVTKWWKMQNNVKQKQKQNTGIQAYFNF